MITMFHIYIYIYYIHEEENKKKPQSLKFIAIPSEIVQYGIEILEAIKPCTAVSVVLF